ncbi:uncharacterized protein N7473_002693 [Penicillium subrubescens]|uniref:uncharacterized protein n=1 Tax=Penicillium subrubescens TaxID=1316194 RepID=UPI002545B461|nr:uncharacterized protein N7473_002693 [Penicillium subrubescens]KAJ5905777.1 hypothetical protein N7473_002693 [Penicillium subrubescens]
MFDAIKNWFSPAQENENKWDARNVELQQPNSPAGPAMNNEAVNQQPGGPEQMNVHMRGGGEGEDVCCGICAGLCCFECCECCC